MALRVIRKEGDSAKCCSMYRYGSMIGKLVNLPT